jgi:prolipoprotein diacylglyceryl transferase
VWLLADCLAPGLLLAQGLGRLGNWWNQELFGKPTDLPWGVEIDAVKRPLEHIEQATFHPTFLYELIWDFAAAAILVFVIERRLRPRPPGVFAAYIALYCVGRFFMELLRIDPAHEIAGLRLNAWMSLIGIVVGVTWYVLSQRRGRPARPKQSKPPAPKRKMAVPGGRVRPPG